MHFLQSFADWIRIVERRGSKDDEGRCCDFEKQLWIRRHVVVSSKVAAKLGALNMTMSVTFPTRSVACTKGHTTLATCRGSDEYEVRSSCHRYEMVTCRTSGSSVEKMYK